MITGFNLNSRASTRACTHMHSLRASKLTLQVLRATQLFNFALLHGLTYLPWLTFEISRRSWLISRRIIGTCCSTLCLSD